jgi:peptide/nickel transport system substrate-binding protein
MGSVTSLDPAGATSFENIWIVNQIYNGLVEMNDSMLVVPSIARKWEVSHDGLIYTFHLRNDVYFQDNKCFANGKGRKVSSQDFKYSFNRLLDASVSGATTLLSSLDKSKPFVAPDDSTFVIHLKKAFTPFLGILTMKYFSVIPHEAITLYGEDFRANPVGTGPFKFKMWEEGLKLVLLKNENYFEKEGSSRLPYLDAVSVSFIKDKETSFLNFMKGNTDMVSGLDAINTDEVFTSDGKLKDKFKNKFTLQTKAFIKTDYLGFVMDDKLDVVKHSPLKMKAIRQAINYGFDRKKLVKYLRRNLGIPAIYGFIPPGMPSFDSSEVKGYEYNPEKAKKLIADAGYNEKNKLPEISLATSEQYLELAEYIQSQLAEIGIQLKIDVLKPSVLAEKVSNSKINFFRKSWVADYADEENFLSLYYSKNFSPNGFNYTHYSNPEFDTLFAKSQTELNDSIRYKYYKKMDKMIIEDAAVVPLYYDEVVRLVQNNISGLKINSMNLLSLNRVKKQNTHSH